MNGTDVIFPVLFVANVWRAHRAIAGKMPLLMALPNALCAGFVLGLWIAVR